MGEIIKIKGEDVKILFEFNDTENIKLGNNLHIPKMDVHHSFELGKIDFDWSVESMMVCVEMAIEKGVDIDFEYGKSFNCKVNGQYYNVVNDYDKIHIITELKID